MRSGVDCHGAADQADVQAAFLVDQAGDGGFVRGEEVLQANLLGPLAAFIHNDAVKGRRDQLLVSISVMIYWKVTHFMDRSSMAQFLLLRLALC